jgi:hypothetical protein
MLVFVAVVVAAGLLVAGLLAGQAALLWAALAVSLAGAALLAFVLLRGRNRTAGSAEAGATPNAESEVDEPPTLADEPAGEAAEAAEPAPAASTVAAESAAGQPAKAAESTAEESTVVAESAADEPAAETESAVVAEPAVPAKIETAEPAAAKATEPVKSEAAEPVATTTAEPAAAATAEPAAAATAEPTKGETAEPAAATATEPAEVSGPAAGATVADGPGDLLVRVIPGRRRFHVDDCRLLSGHSAEQISLDEARDEGFTACTTCIPKRESLASVG